MEEIFSILLNFSSEIGYWGIILLMTVESSFIPFPSEIVIPPAAYLAAQGEFNIFLVIVSGILGSLIGALINYYLSLNLGRTIVYALINKKFARFLLLSDAKLKHAEDFFLKYGRISTFIGRLIPAIRQLISIPAGFSKMNIGSFIFYTFLGSGIWTIILAVIGYVFGAKQEVIFEYYHYFKYGIYSIIAFIGLLIIVYWVKAIIMKNKK